MEGAGVGPHRKERFFKNMHHTMAHGDMWFIPIEARFLVRYFLDTDNISAHKKKQETQEDIDWH